MLTRWLVSCHDFYEALQIGVKNVWVFAVALQVLQGAIDNYQGLIHFFLPMDFSEYFPAMIDVVRGRFDVFLIFPWKRSVLYNKGSVFLKGTGYNFFDGIFFHTVLSLMKNQFYINSSHSSSIFWSLPTHCNAFIFLFVCLFVCVRVCLA